MQGHTGAVQCLCFTPDGRMLASGGAEGALRVWNASKGRQLRCMMGHGGPITALCISNRARWLASSSADTTVRVWDLESGQVAVVLDRHMDKVMLELLGRVANCLALEAKLHVLNT